MTNKALFTQMKGIRSLEENWMYHFTHKGEKKLHQKKAKYLVYLLLPSTYNTYYPIDSASHNKRGSITIARPAHSVERLVLLIYKASGSSNKCFNDTG